MNIIKNEIKYKRFLIPYRVYGESDTCLLCINGTQQTMGVWRQFISMFSKKYKIVLFDFRVNAVNKPLTLEEFKIASLRMGAQIREYTEGGGGSMDFLSILKDAVKECSRVIKFGAGIQSKARNRLINDLQNICSRVESAYSAVLARLHPVKDSFQNPKALAKELKRFAADSKTRKVFKPDHLCGEVDTLLMDLESNLDPLKYSIDVRKISSLRDNIQRVGNFDMEMFEAYDQFTRELDSLGMDIETADAELKEERSVYARHVISDFEKDLFDAIKSMREAKDLILH